ncbi:4Fe-4S binding protein [Halomonas sp. M5N1S17]|uniref:4Fe-4S dicluster domain-containing protein n=1 Tax=Halomonas alkalisoli TaxID=2907158 RepID=UPI001F15F2D7|nr:4Fe-4S binding protein [Halomonas alkalisoli]MCE9662819.1 4Fe-4S binding protein [Halomonas alkalisoli]
MFYINPVECIECGMCESICPVDAIRYSDEVSEDEYEFVKINEEVFYDDENNVTMPGGWSRGDAPLKDHPSVRSFTNVL